MIKLLVFGKYFYKGIIMKKFYYGPIVLGLAALAVGTQVGDATTVLATEDKTEVAGKTDETKDTDTEKETAKSTYGTFDEAFNNYKADLAMLKAEADSLNGTSEVSEHFKELVKKVEGTEITDGESLSKGKANINVLNMYLDDITGNDLTVKTKGGDLTAKNVPYQMGNTGGRGDMPEYFEFKSGVQNILMSDGSKLSISFDEADEISKAELTNSNGETTEVSADAISTTPNSKYVQAEMYGYLAFQRDSLDRKDQSNPDVQKAVQSIPADLKWMQTDADDATVSEIATKKENAVKNYIDKVILLPDSPEVFPNPDGTTYTPETDSGKDNPGTDTPSNPDKPSKPSTNTNNNHHNSSNNNNTNTDKDNTTKPEEKPADEKTVVEHRTVFVTSTTKNVQLYTDGGNLIKNRALGKDSSWVGDKLMTLNGVRYIRVATNEWAKLDDGLEVTSINETVKTKNQAQLYTATGEIVKNRALAKNTAWYTDRVATINGQKMYRVSTNEWVAANDIK